MLSFVFVELVVHDTCQNYICPVARRNYPVYTYLLQLLLSIFCLQRDHQIG